MDDLKKEEGKKIFDTRLECIGFNMYSISTREIYNYTNEPSNFQRLRYNNTLGFYLI